MNRINQSLSLMATHMSAERSSAAQRLTSIQITQTAGGRKESLKDSISLVSGSTGGGRKEGKLGLEADKIKAMKEEAGERFDHAMAAAGREMVAGVASSVAAVVAAAVEVGSKASSSAWGYKQIQVPRKSDRIQAKILEQEIMISRAGVGASDSKEASEAARDRKKSGMDSIQKFLDILRSMNPQI